MAADSTQHNIIGEVVTCCIVNQSNNFLSDQDYSTRFTTITGELIIESAFNISGKIVYLGQIPNSQWLARILRLQNRGAVAIIYAAPSCKGPFRIAYYLLLRTLLYGRGRAMGLCFIL